MRIHRFFAFQTRAINELHKKSAQAQLYYATDKTPQVISFTAPTGAGKTIMMASLIENIYVGNSPIPEQPNAIFVWLSDSPELNQQSRDKIEGKCDKILPNQCVTISEDSFDMEVLEDGHIYFLNTQKLGKNSNLVSKGDTRQYTIFETLTNTVERKFDHLYFIIDEAHRGAKTNQTTIMQKFIKGSDADGLPAMPVVIGMSATSERFNTLIARSASTTHRVIVTPDEVRESGLLKDRIEVVYPGSNATSSMALLEAAVDDWKDKIGHWKLFCDRYHHAKVDPLFLIQVENGTDNELSNTDLAECVRRIEKRLQYTFSDGEIVHTFGQKTTTLELAGRNVFYAEPSQINDDRRIRVVFFKENLSTGWDCPRAETMMSFRHASDATYIAQLLGRMVRTPIGSRIESDESLNEVRLYLPYFDENTVKRVIDELQNAEGGALPTDISSTSVENDSTRFLSSKRPVRTRVIKRVISNDGLQTIPGLFFFPPTEGNGTGINNTENIPAEEKTNGTENKNDNITEVSFIDNVHLSEDENIDYGKNSEEEQPKADTIEKKEGKTATIQFDYEDIDRNKIIQFINGLCLTTYNIRNVSINNYMTSMFAIARFLNINGIDSLPIKSIKSDIVEMIHNYSLKLKIEGDYDGLKAKILSFELHSKVFDVFGRTHVVSKDKDFFSSSDTNLDIQIRQAENDLGKEGIVNEYGSKYLDENEPNDYKIDIILFTLNGRCMEKLENYAKEKFHLLNDTYRRSVSRLDEQKKKVYADIVKDGNKVSKLNYSIPTGRNLTKGICSDTGELYYNHLLADEETGSVRIKLNSWESDIIEEESRRSDFVCWLRNPSRGTNSLCLRYIHNGEDKPFYPDFLIVRKDATDGFVVDIIEPHSPAFDDNVGKAKALAAYAQEHSVLGRVQLIRATDNPHQYVRLDMCKSSIREQVLKLHTSEDLNCLFDKGTVMNTHHKYATEIHSGPEKQEIKVEVHNHIEHADKIDVFGPYVQNQTINSK